MPRVIFTGGPGAGKTTLLSHLAAAGYATVHDSARAIIAERRARGLSRRPDAQEFARETLRRDIDSYHRCAETGDWVFFDRGVIEGIAMVQASCRHGRRSSPPTPSASSRSTTACTSTPG